MFSAKRRQELVEAEEFYNDSPFLDEEKTKLANYKIPEKRQKFLKEENALENSFYDFRRKNVGERADREKKKIDKEIEAFRNSMPTNIVFSVANRKEYNV